MHPRDPAAPADDLATVLTKRSYDDANDERGFLQINEAATQSLRNRSFRHSRRRHAGEAVGDFG